MSIISRVPRSLLALLGIQNFGENPREFANVVSGVVDLTPMFLINDVTIDGGTSVAGLAAGGFLAVGLVGPGMMRFHGGLSLSLELLAGQVGSCRIAARQAAGSEPQVIGLSEVIGTSTAVVPATAFGAARTFTPPLLLPPGTQVGIEAFTAIPATARITLGILSADYRG